MPIWCKLFRHALSRAEALDLPRAGRSKAARMPIMNIVIRSSKSVNAAAVRLFGQQTIIGGLCLSGIAAQPTYFRPFGYRQSGSEIPAIQLAQTLASIARNLYHRRVCSRRTSLL